MLCIILITVALLLAKMCCVPFYVPRRLVDWSISMLFHQERYVGKCNEDICAIPKQLQCFVSSLAPVSCVIRPSIVHGDSDRSRCVQISATEIRTQWKQHKKHISVAIPPVLFV